MRLHLKDGKLIPPRSLAAGVYRLSQLRFESKRIEEQLADPARLSQAEWRKSAEQALTMFGVEERQLAAWVDAERDTLLVELVEIFDALEDDAVDFSDEEKRIIEKLHQYVAEKERKHAEGEAGRES